LPSLLRSLRLAGLQQLELRSGSLAPSKAGLGSEQLLTRPESLAAHTKDDEVLRRALEEDRPMAGDTRTNSNALTRGEAAVDAAPHLGGPPTDITEELGAFLRVRQVRGQELEISALIVRILCRPSTEDDGNWTHETREHAPAMRDARISQRDIVLGS